MLGELVLKIRIFKSFMTETGKINWKRVIAVILLVTLILSIVYTVVKIIKAPYATTEEYTKIKSDYVLMFLQCMLGLIVMFIPSLVERKFSIDIPNYVEILYFIFLYCAIYLGEVHDFYYRIPNWDNVLHALSGAMLGTLGFSILSILNKSTRIGVYLSRSFLILFSFCFALSIGTVWEIYEYIFDGLFSLNMQKFKLKDGTVLIGRAALSDTMEDLIIDAASALIVILIRVLLIKRDKERE